MKLGTTLDHPVSKRFKRDDGSVSEPTIFNFKVGEFLEVPDQFGEALLATYPLKYYKKGDKPPVLPEGKTHVQDEGAMFLAQNPGAELKPKEGEKKDEDEPVIYSEDELVSFTPNKIDELCKEFEVETTHNMKVETKIARIIEAQEKKIDSM